MWQKLFPKWQVSWFATSYRSGLKVILAFGHKCMVSLLFLLVLWCLTWSLLDMGTMAGIGMPPYQGQAIQRRGPLPFGVPLPLHALTLAGLVPPLAAWFCRLGLWLALWRHGLSINTDGYGIATSPPFYPSIYRAVLRADFSPSFKKI